MQNMEQLSLMRMVMPHISRRRKTKIRSFGIFVCQKLTHTRIAVRDANAGLDEFKKQIEAHYDGTDERYYGDEDSGKWKKNLRKSLIYAIFAIFVGLCVAVAL